MVSERVSDAIVRFGDDHALDALIRNDGAQPLARPAWKPPSTAPAATSCCTKASSSARDMPLDLLNEMYFVVEAGLRDQILQRNASVDPSHARRALTKARERMRKSVGDMTAEAKNAMAFIQSKKNSGELNARLLVSLYREAKHRALPLRPCRTHQPRSPKPPPT